MEGKESNEAMDTTEQEKKKRPYDFKKYVGGLQRPTSPTMEREDRELSMGGVTLPEETPETTEIRLADGTSPAFLTEKIDKIDTTSTSETLNTEEVDYLKDQLIRLGHFTVSELSDVEKRIFEKQLKNASHDMGTLERSCTSAPGESTLKKLSAIASIHRATVEMLSTLPRHLLKEPDADLRSTTEELFKRGLDLLKGNTNDLCSNINYLLRIENDKHKVPTSTSHRHLEDRLTKKLIDVPNIGRPIEVLKRLSTNIADGPRIRRPIEAPKRQPSREHDHLEPEKKRHSDGHEDSLEPTKCAFCRSDTHDSISCRKFGTTRKRLKQINPGYCRRCLKRHYSNRCRNKKRCPTCNGPHHPAVCPKRDEGPTRSRSSTS